MRGFTLIELLVVLGIFVIVAALSLPFVQSFQVSSDFHTHINTLKNTLRHAQQKAITGQENSAWGVYFNEAEKKFILFKGASYALRDPGEDLEFVYPGIFSISSDFGNEIYFNLYSGAPSTFGTTTIISANNEVEYVVIKNSGLIKIND